MWTCGSVFYRQYRLTADHKQFRIMKQIRPSKFGGSFNKPNVPTINVVVDMVAPQNAGLPR